MKDYLIRFDADGRRQETYADGVHYDINPDGTITDGSVVVADLLAQGYVWVDADEYVEYLNGKVRGEDGKPTDYVAPEPTEAEKKSAKISAIKAKYNAQIDALVTARVKAAMMGADTSKLDAQYKTILANMAAEIKEA